MNVNRKKIVYFRIALSTILWVVILNSQKMRDCDKYVQYMPHLYAVLRLISR